MKKYFIIMGYLLSTPFVFADFVEKSFEGMEVPVNEAVSHFNEWFGTGNSEFQLFFDETDELGMRDMDYQQYINGIKVENCALYVHSKNGFITLVNGDILPLSKVPQKPNRIGPKKAVRIATGQDSIARPIQQVIIHMLNKEGNYDFYTTYKVITEYEEIYVDCSNGDIIQSLPLFQNSTSCQVQTRYNGLQSISCETSNAGKYILRNDSKNLRTLYANYNPYTGPMPADRYNYTNSTTNWSGNYLTSVVVNAVHNEGWWNPLVGDASPDLYIKITDANGNLLYVSDYKEDCGSKTPFFVTFRISKMIEVPTNGGIKIEVWDEDLGDDTKGSTITLANNTIGTHSWGNSTFNTEGYCVISQWHPAMDVQWGLEKTWEFYNTEFNHQGFDGNNALTRAILHSPENVANIEVEIKNLDMHPNNAFAHDEDDVAGAYLFFGIGNERGESMVDLNCVTHEFTHLVTAYRPKGKLVYQGESGAINEGYSDAMAVSAEARLTGSVNWLYGHGVQMLGIDNKVYNYCRNLANPKAGGPEGPKPDTYGKTNWYDPTDTSEKNDKGGVHVNNSIFTHWFYILCEGKIGVNDNQQSYSVSPIGLDKALKIIWRMHRKYLPAQSTFAVARKYAIQSAKDLYPTDKSVEKAVTDAWYAVGVGDKYQEVDCKSVPYTESFAASQGDFSVVNLTLPSGFTSIWNWDAQYGMVAKCIKGSTKYESEAWLISPCIELPADKSCVVSFSHAAKFFQDTKQMSIWISANYDESAPEDAQWTRLVIPTYPTGNNWNWFDSGEIDLSEYKGQNVNIAFCYKSNTNYAPQWEIKNFAVKLSNLMAVENVSIDQSSATKILRNGQIFILRGDKTYTLTGQEVK